MLLDDDLLLVLVVVALPEIRLEIVLYIFFILFLGFLIGFFLLFAGGHCEPAIFKLDFLGISRNEVLNLFAARHPRGQELLLWRKLLPYILLTGGRLPFPCRTGHSQLVARDYKFFRRQYAFLEELSFRVYLPVNL